MHDEAYFNRIYYVKVTLRGKTEDKRWQAVLLNCEVMGFLMYLKAELGLHRWTSLDEECRVTSPYLLFYFTVFHKPI